MYITCLCIVYIYLEQHEHDQRDKDDQEDGARLKTEDTHMSSSMYMYI